MITDQAGECNGAILQQPSPSGVHFQSSVRHLKQHYEDLADKPFFAGLVQYMASGPVVPMVWEGQDAVRIGRAMLGETKPQDSAPGTIRGDFALQVGR